MLRALNAEARLFPELHIRYFEEVVAPRRASMLAVIHRGLATGEIRAEIDPELAVGVLVDPILAHSAADQMVGRTPTATSLRIVNLVFDGIWSRHTVAVCPSGERVNMQAASPQRPQRT
ncbi:MAG: TetR/AcrR family transcriptional regulator C-terminal ligand-binding domain-containing protein [Chloroflexi bacterium]|nr:TetR/AcrR family transcriptional regulator C-terminal ligand-binding domain-containing protein [Chloroflexota bacterium]